MKKILSLLCVPIVLLGIASPVSAHQSPSGCNSNRLTLSIAKDKTTVTLGDVITYTVTLSNVDASILTACDIDDADVIVILPGYDGQPTGIPVVMTTNASYPAGTPITIIGTTQYTVNVDPTIHDIVAQVSVDGVLHDAPINHTANITKTIGTAFVAPEIPPEEPEEPQNPPDTSTSSSSIPRMPNAGRP